MARQRTDYIVIHCSATKPDQDIGASEIDAMHRARGWSGIGYHVVIRRDGRIEFGRHMNDVGAHARGHNWTSVAVCLVGGLLPDGSAGKTIHGTFTPAQQQALMRAVQFLRGAYPDADVLGHRDLSPDVDGDGVVERHEWLKQCPCFDVRQIF